MDGLECSEVLYSNLLTDNPTKRLDSEFFSKYYAQVSQIVTKQRTKKLGAITLWITQGPNPVFSPNGTIPCLTGRNIAGGRVNYSDPDYIDDLEYTALKRFQLIPGDTLITLKGKGSIGKIGYVVESRKAVFSRNIGIVRPSSIEPALLNAYLMSKYGHELVLRGETGGTGQTTLTTTHLKLMDIPVFELLGKNIKKLMDKSEQVRYDSICTYLEAEKLLLSMLGITDFTASNQAVSIKTLSESFDKSGRLDAEYYQQKFDIYEEVISKHSKGFVYVREKFAPVKKRCNRDQDEYNYIEIGDVDVGSGSATSNAVATVDLPDNAKIMTQQGDVLVSTVRPNRGAVAILENSGYLVSGAFTVLRQNADYPKEILHVLLRTSIYRDWLLRYNVGTSYPVIKDNDILNMPIPVFDDQTQKKVMGYVQESFFLRHKSEQLLEYAKTAVEIAIEQGEEKAIKWLEKKDDED